MKRTLSSYYSKIGKSGERITPRKQFKNLRRVTALVNTKWLFLQPIFTLHFDRKNENTLSKINLINKAFQGVFVQIKVNRNAPLEANKVNRELKYIRNE
ncbi:MULTISPECIES: hypothetical protein [unclassified Dysgonomonas]|uniref:hypothetical protein n=1 Tax=unclassified Dysgonomonas TaxID=2630389 RepID=UPI0025C15EF7|nr:MULTISPECIES: hypothetical protein [unclassified Dysgonomonas]